MSLLGLASEDIKTNMAYHMHAQSLLSKLELGGQKSQLLKSFIWMLNDNDATSRHYSHYKLCDVTS